MALLTCGEPSSEKASPQVSWKRNAEEGSPVYLSRDYTDQGNGRVGLVSTQAQNLQKKTLHSPFLGQELFNGLTLDFCKGFLGRGMCLSLCKGAGMTFPENPIPSCPLPLYLRPQL
jgi:hypothetical protein